MERLRESLRDAPVVEKEGYHYFVHPVSDGVPTFRPDLLREVAVGVVRTADVEGVDKIVTPAAMGIHISTAVSLMTDLPMVVVRKRRYGLPGEVSISKRTGYAESEMYVNDVAAGDRVLVIDDVLSTGGTMLAVLDALDSIGAEVADAVAVIRKQGPTDLDDTDHRVKALVTVTVEDGRVRIVDPTGDRETAADDGETAGTGRD
ncbi:MAG: hypoxanthine/guanine phosphoribosyltransferase [Haloferacaceae archaeon]